jgi:outer membrane protein OmpA-like peptidoglycan-associated protein
VSCWTSYREFWFADGRADLHDAEMAKVSEIANYMKKNPSIQVGIDATLDPQNHNQRDQDLSNQRVKAIRDALVKAGVPADKIKAGAFGDPKLQRDRRVEVLYASAK